MPAAPSDISPGQAPQIGADRGSTQGPDQEDSGSDGRNSPGADTLAFSSESDRQEAGSDQPSEEDRKKRARMMRNRESASLSRQRKKMQSEEKENQYQELQRHCASLNGKQLELETCSSDFGYLSVLIFICNR